MEHMELDVSNDPEIERLGANAAAVYAQEFWKKLTTAARADALLLDPVWESELAPSDATGTTASAGLSFQQQSQQTGGAVHTRKISITESASSDHRLYQRFRSNFSYFPVALIDADNEIQNPLASPLWASLLTASEGRVKDFNFMTLLRADCNTCFYMTEQDSCPGLLVVPRAQFLFIELARCKEGCYGRSFRQALQVFDVKTAADALKGAGQEDSEDAAVRALDLMLQQWPCPYPSALRTTGMVKILKVAAGNAISPPLQKLVTETLQRWQDVMELGRLRREQPTDWTERQVDSVHRAAKALFVAPVVALVPQKEVVSTTATERGGGGMFGMPVQAPARQIVPAVTQTTSSLDDLVKKSSELDAVAETFRDYGIVVLPDIVETGNVSLYSQQASQALDDLCREQLEPRGLKVDGEQEFDFMEVRQRPGHRVDNRYHILEPSDSPIATLGRRLVRELPKLLFPNDPHEEVSWQLLYAGVVHSFARENPQDPIPEAQLWHRDGPSVFTDKHHASHCINVFVPLVDVSTKNGTTEFIAGTHDDRMFEDVASDVLLTAQQDPSVQHKLAVRADVAAGTVIAFDTRVLHRGLANASMLERPVLYFTMARDWFQEQHMFLNESIIKEPTPQVAAHKSLCKRLFQSVTGCSPDPKVVDYGHPHYTTRFDLLLLEHLQSTSGDNQTVAMMNVSALMAFCGLSTGDRDAICREFAFALSEDAVERKRQTLEDARRRRKEARQQGDDEDFASISTDMSDVAALYELTSRILFEETTLLSKLGFTSNEFGIYVALAAFKAFASTGGLEDVGISAARIEESFTSWWHAGTGRFSFVEGNAENDGERSQRSLLVIFSSLGSGIARPEWQGSIRGSMSLTLDVLHVMDPAFSWYCQSPECDWKGTNYYLAQLTKLTSHYKSVMYLGDSMGAAAALRFSSLADRVLAFTPQVDISSYNAITRKDFSLSTKKEFQRELIATMKTSKAGMTIHYGEHCEEDVRQIKLLPELLENVKLVSHDFDDHILSLHLRDRGLLSNIVESAIGDFVHMHGPNGGS